MKPTTSGSPTADELMTSFLAELSILRVRVKAVAKLRRETLVEGLAGLDEKGGQLQVKALQLMDEIEANFRIIRRKLAS
jgi:hypothetical protein